MERVAQRELVESEPNGVDANDEAGLGHSTQTWCTGRFESRLLPRADQKWALAGEGVVDVRANGMPTTCGPKTGPDGCISG